jgi:mono/diheme cytochrome c family protein
MAIRWLNGEWTARFLLLFCITGLLVIIVASRRSVQAVEIHAAMPEKGGWLPGDLSTEVGVPLHLRLTSDDVMHGFAIGQQSWPAVDVKPGQVTELSLSFDKPGTYTYYCTRWCGPNHWRMRGTIEVTGGQAESSNESLTQKPLYMTLGLDIDAAHAVDVEMNQLPSALKGSRLKDTLPTWARPEDVYWNQTPYEFWKLLRADPVMNSLSDTDIWDLIAYTWLSQSTPQSLQLGRRLYAVNCSACHGVNGDGAGIFAVEPGIEMDAASIGQELMPASDFTNSQNMLGSSTALLQGKIIRGGMGTGMPYWGPIFSNEEIEALLDYIWTFQFPESFDG